MVRPAVAPLFARPEGRDLSRTNAALAGVYVSVNTLFVWKYAPEYLSAHAAVPLAYAAWALMAFGLVTAGRPRLPRFARGRRAAWLFIVVLAVALYALMTRFDPGALEVGRYPAYRDWIERLLRGEFPYASETHPTAFPFLFLAALPFHLLGDLGLLQIVSFALFGLVLQVTPGHEAGAPLRGLLLLLVAPAFLYEIVTRSELFSNMVMVLALLVLCARYGPAASSRGLVLLGILTGLVLSTRAPVLLVYVVGFGYLVRRRGLRPGILAGTAAATWLLVLVPFLAWNPGYFLVRGPFVEQAAHIPAWQLALALAAALLCGLYVRSWRGVHAASALLLFVVVLGPFVVGIRQYGLHDLVFADVFDISYFCFSLPFLIVASLPGAAEQPVSPGAVRVT